MVNFIHLIVTVCLIHKNGVPRKGIGQSISIAVMKNSALIRHHLGIEQLLFIATRTTVPNHEHQHFGGLKNCVRMRSDVILAGNWRHNQ